MLHPYAGSARIRLEGIISAHTRGHPLIIGCKGNQYFYKHHTFPFFFHKNHLIKIEKGNILVKYCEIQRSKALHHFEKKRKMLTFVIYKHYTYKYNERKSKIYR